jgi:hypothetical protein
MDKSLAVQDNGKTSLMAFDMRQVEAQIQQFVPALRELVTNGRRLSDEQIRGRAMFAAVNGLDPISEVHTITDRDGKTLTHSMAIDGYRRKCQEQAGYGNEIITDFIELPADGLKRFGDVLIGYECRLRDGASYTQWQRRLRDVGNALREAMGGQVSFQDLMSVVGQPPVYTGVGLVYRSELSEYKDKNFNPIERAKKRAELNARKKRFPTNADISEGQTIIEGAVEIVDSPADNHKARNDKPANVDTIMGQLYGEPVQAAVFRPEPEPEPETAPIERPTDTEASDILAAAAELGAVITTDDELIDDGVPASEPQPPAADVDPSTYWKYILQERKMTRDWGLALLERTGGAFSEALALAKKTK